MCVNNPALVQKSCFHSVPLILEIRTFINMKYAHLFSFKHSDLPRCISDIKLNTKRITNVPYKNTRKFPLNIVMFPVIHFSRKCFSKILNF